MATRTLTADPLRRVCSAALSGHRDRARKDKQTLDYGLAALEALARKATVCCYCGAVLTPGRLAFDHATPTCRVADYSLANIVVSCALCNSAKGVMSADEFKALLAFLKGCHPRVYGDVLGRLRSGARRYRGR